jgi:hypothetical protein
MLLATNFVEMSKICKVEVRSVSSRGLGLGNGSRGRWQTSNRWVGRGSLCDE